MSDRKSVFSTITRSIRQKKIESIEQKIILSTFLEKNNLLTLLKTTEQKIGKKMEEYFINKFSFCWIVYSQLSHQIWEFQEIWDMFWSFHDKCAYFKT